MIGQQLGPYKILNLIGQGGMGIVYKGIHSKLEQIVAIKMLSPEFSENVTMRQRFMQEAKLQVRLSHPNVVNILNYLEDNRNIYLIMEFVQGETLEKKLQRIGTLPVFECYRITMGVLNALSFMHKQSIIHRDIKPSNIMITDQGQIKVTDFGIAKATGEKGLTKTGVQLGTVWYMSPEQIHGGKVDETSDLYALGVSLFQMTTGQVPFQHDSDFEIMKAHIEQSPPPPEDINPLIPQQLSSIILKALAKVPGDRFQSADDFRTAIENSQQDEVSAAWEQDLNGKPAVDEHTSAQKRAVAMRGHGGAAEELILGRFEKKTFYLLAGTAFIILMILAYLLFFSGIFNKDEKGDGHQIPLTLISPVIVSPPSKEIESSDEEKKVLQDDGTELPEKPEEVFELRNPVQSNTGEQAKRSPSRQEEFTKAPLNELPVNKYKPVKSHTKIETPIAPPKKLPTPDPLKKSKTTKETATSKQKTNVPISKKKSRQDADSHKNWKTINSPKRHSTDKESGEGEYKGWGIIK